MHTCRLAGYLALSAPAKADRVRIGGDSRYQRRFGIFRKGARSVHGSRREEVLGSKAMIIGLRRRI